MKKIKYFIIIFSIVACSNTNNEEKLLIKSLDDNSKKENLFNESITKDSLEKNITKKYTDGEYVNKANILRMQAGGRLISKDDTIIAKKALLYLNKALKINKNNEVAFSNKIKVLCLIGNYREALNCIQKKINLKQNYAEGYFFQGLIYDKLNITDTAQIKYSKAINFFKTRIYKIPNINNYITLYYLYMLTNQKELALENIDYLQEKFSDNKGIKYIKQEFNYFDKTEFINNALN